MTTSKYKICRRLGPGVYEKCQTQKFVIAEGKRKRNDKKPKTLSDYGQQLLEKQRIRFSYGISEKQLRNYATLASETKGVMPAEKLEELLERRLDNVVYRLGLAGTRAGARQMVAHGHILVNGTRVKVASHIVRPGDVISIREGSRTSPLFTDIDKRLKSYTWPNWLSFTPEQLTATVSALPKPTESFLNFNAVLEFYTR